MIKRILLIPRNRALRPAVLEVVSYLTCVLSSLTLQSAYQRNLKWIKSRIDIVRSVVDDPARLNMKSRLRR